MGEKTFISISEKPGTFGLNFHNKGYDFFNLNNRYIPLEVRKEELGGIIQLIKGNFAGCSVSMPHKEKIISFLDSLDPIASKINAVNTIVNHEGKLKGFNTDYYGAKIAISKKGTIARKKVLVLGAGGVAKAIGFALKSLGARIYISNRTKKRAEELAKIVGGQVVDWNKRNDFEGTLLINATSIGFVDKKEMPINTNSLHNFKAVMDVVIGDTTLIKEAIRQKKNVIRGLEMTTYQAAKQFEIYTGKKPPLSFLKQFLEKKESNKKINFILDVDGVMTDGQFHYSSKGKEYKIFGPHDADGLKLIKDKVNILFITADKRGFPISKKRIEDMKYPLELVTEKDRYSYIKETFGFEHTIYMGDGIFDATIIRDCMFGIAPANARIEAKRLAKFVTPSKSGEGAVCDACIKINKMLKINAFKL